MNASKRLPFNIQRSLIFLFLGALLSSYSTHAQAPLDIRVALVIGNAAYKNIPALANSTNDARSMAMVLRKLGFSVIEVVDGDKAKMAKAIEQMQSLLQGKQAVGMLYYAGHGLQLDWRNYMVPVDAKLSSANEVPAQTIDIENVIGVMKQSAILQFPNGMLSELANTKLELLDKAQIKPQADKQGRVQEFAPRRYAQGDVFEFIGKDGYTGLVKWQQSFTVLNVDDEGAELQGSRTGRGSWKQRVSHAGLQYSDNTGKFDPPITLMPAGIVQVGYKWRARTNFTNARNNAQEWLEVVAKVVARETIEVPAGKFDTFKIEIAMQYQSGLRTQLTIWTDPAIGAGIRIKSESRPPRGSADITIRELTSIKRGR